MFTDYEYLYLYKGSTRGNQLSIGLGSREVSSGEEPSIRLGSRKISSGGEDNSVLRAVSAEDNNTKPNNDETDFIPPSLEEGNQIGNSNFGNMDSRHLGSSRSRDSEVVLGNIKVVKTKEFSNPNFDSQV